MTRTRFWPAFTVAFAISVVAPSEASAPRGDNIVQVGGRVALFLQPPASGAVMATVIYEPGNSASEAEARSIERAMEGGMMVGSLRLHPKRLSVHALGGLAGSRLAFVTRGTDYRAIASAAAPRSILTISADPACARSGYCVVAISSSPRVQITISRSAARAAKLRFSSSFLMLVREI